jgi:tetratricopeptide (TPR) repeat protein
MTNIPWYHNVILHSVAGILATVCFGWLFFHKGPSPEKQDETLGIVRSMPDKVAAAVFATLSKQSTQTHDNAHDAPGPDFESAFRQVAQQFQITPEEVQRVAKKWSEEKRNSSNLKDRAKAEFLTCHFSDAAQLFDQAVDEGLARSQKLAAEQEQLIMEVAENLGDSGIAFRFAGRFEDALDRFDRVLLYTRRFRNPVLIAFFQDLRGVCHDELGVRVEGPGALQHLRSAVAAYREALQLWTPQQTNEWATTQRHLGNALSDLAVRGESTETKQLLIESATAFQNASKIHTRESRPQEWALTRLNLGSVLAHEAMQSSSEDAEQLFYKAMEASRQSQTILTRELFTHEWAVAENNINMDLCRLAELKDGVEALRLLSNATRASREILHVVSKDQFPEEWAMAQNVLGMALSFQAVRVEQGEAELLWRDAIRACREELSVFTRERNAQNWGMTQNGLGNALRNLARLKQGAEAAELLTEAIAACRSALEIADSNNFPALRAVANHNLTLAQDALRELKP